jgi:uncharacterized phage protein (TIGR02216 family)
MAIGLGVLGLAPDVFWRMTVREIAAAIEGRMGRATRETPMGRGDLAAMMQRFPDDAS